MKLHGYVWLGDAGHGDRHHTKGKCSPVWDDGSQYHEGEGNRDVMRRVKAKIDAFNDAHNVNIDFRFTVHPDDGRDIPLPNRTAYENDLYRKSGGKTIFISTHSDGFNEERAHGWSVWTSPGQTKSDKVADVAYKMAKKYFPNMTLRKDTRDGDIDKESRFWVLVETLGAAILLENFFHTNEKECREILMTEEGRNKIATYIFDMIIHIEKHGL